MSWAGLIRVEPGQVVVVRGPAGGVATVLDPGWHWRLPIARQTLPLPRVPIAVARELRLSAKDGTRVVVTISGRFGVEPGKEAAWIQASGWRPFVDGLDGVVEPALRSVVSDHAAEQLVGSGAQRRLAERAAAALANAGTRTEGLVLEVPEASNPGPSARLRERVVSLARPTHRKILLVGWDGADWLMIRPLLAAGRLPNLERLMRRGASGELLSQKPLLSPLVWTTIATGKPVVEHGIADFLVREATSGELVPIGSDARRVHALWTILPAFGLHSDVVGWWATWPAEATLGTLVSDRVAYQLFQYRDDAAGLGKVFPPAAWEGVRGRLVTADRITAAELRRFVDVAHDEVARRWEGLPAERRQEDPVNHLRKVLATTRSYHQIALSLLAQQADLTLVYYEGTDTVGHLFARYLAPALPGVDEADVKRYGQALPEFYADLDERLGELVAKAAPDTAILLVSDHGFFTGRARPASDPADFTVGAPQWHRLQGILVAAGGGIPRGQVRDATVLDVAPTLLALLGLPIPKDMPGHALEALLPPDARPHGERTLATYEELPRAAAATATRSAAADQDRLRELVALGYVSTGTLEASQASASGASHGTTQAFATEAYNLGRILQQKGDLAGARRQYEVALTRLPSFGQGYASLAQVASLEGKHDEAFDTLARGFARSGTMPLGALTGLVDEAKGIGRLAEARRLLEGLATGHGQSSAYHAAVGLLHEQEGQIEAALASYRESLAVNPLDPLSIERTIDLLRQAGREPEARRIFAATEARAQGSLGPLNQLAVVGLRQGWARESERLFRQVLDSDPDNPGVLANLAASLAQQRRATEAALVIREAVRLEPDNAQYRFNLGALLAEQGRSEEALASFEQARQKGLRGARLEVAMAKVLFRMGQLERSRERLRQALAVEPGDREANALLQALAP